MKRETQRTYTLYGQSYDYAQAKAKIDAYRQTITGPRQRYAGLLPYIPTSSYLLDYGCGWGAFAAMVHEQRNCRVDGIDLDMGSIEIARDLVGEKDGLTFARRSIQEIAAEQYDVVVSTQVAEHTHNPGNYVKECNRVLKPAGLLVISVPNIMNLRMFLPMLTRRHNARYQRISAEMRDGYNKVHHHIQAWDPATFCRFLCTLGFDYVDHAFLEGVPLPGNRYWHTRLPGLRNLSYTMLFQMRKRQFINVANED